MEETPCLSSETMAVRICEADLNDPADAEALTGLLNVYIKDEMGGGELLQGSRKIKLLSDLRTHAAKLILFAKIGNIYAGMAVCFWEYSTFRVCRLLNIHDLVVLPGYRDKGIGRKLMEAVEQKAFEEGCGKLTLEVRYDNERARHLYMTMGYGEAHPLMSFWVKNIPSRESLS